MHRMRGKINKNSLNDSWSQIQAIEGVVNFIPFLGFDDVEMFTSEVHDPYARTTGSWK